MNIEYLREFVELSRQLNFSSAAMTLHLTQPTLSKHVKGMEQELGVMLVERSPSENARLTPAGQLFFEQAQKILRIYDDMLPRLRELGQRKSGRIVVRSPRNEYSQPLLGYLHEFQTLYPCIDIVMLPWNKEDGFRDVFSGTVDFAYVGHISPELTAAQTPDIKLVAFARTEIYLWADKEHQLAKAERLDVHSLNGASILIPANEKHDTWQGCINNIITSNHLDCRTREKYCDSLEDLMLARAQADDLMLCDEYLVRNSSPLRMRTDRIARRFDPPLELDVFLAYCSEKAGAAESDRQAVELFADFLRAKKQGQAQGTTSSANGQKGSDLGNNDETER